MKELSYKAKTLATKLSNESKDLFDSDDNTIALKIGLSIDEVNNLKGDITN